jgi:hypothetical protein
LFEICDSLIQGLIAAEMVEPFRACGQAMDNQGAGPPDGPPNFGQLLTLCGNHVCFVCQAGKLI